MKVGFATQRRADRFDALLSGEITAADDTETELVMLVTTMQEFPPVEARPEFVAALRERLMTEAATLPTPALDRATAAHLSLSQPTVRRERRIATVLGGLAVASATTSMAVASQGALPGETLYPVKRAIENAQSTFQSDDAGKSHTLLEHAEQRLAEAKELSNDGSDAAEVIEALDGLNSQASEAAATAIDEYRESGEERSVRDVRAFAQRAIAELTALSEAVPEQARPALVGTVNALRNVDTAATQACPSCGGPATLPDPTLVASLEDLLSGDPQSLVSLARSAEDIAAEVPRPSPAPARPSDDPSTAAEAAPTPTAPESGSKSDPAEPAPTPVPDPTATFPTKLPEPPIDRKSPVRTLVDEVRTDLEDLGKQTQSEDWTLLENGLPDGRTEGLGLSGGSD